MEEIHAYGSRFFLQLGAGFGRAQMLFPGMERNLDAVKDMLIAPSDGLPNIWEHP
jgi:2-enoate reductase